jgi:hypothetical protein
MKNIIITFCFLFLFSCKEEIVPLYNVDDNSKNIPEDIVVNVSNFIRCGCHWRVESDKNYDKIIRFSKSYFSQDSSKVFLIVTHQIDGKKNNANSDALFQIQGDTFIGYKTNGQWLIYYYEANMPSGYFSYLEVENGLINYFEGEHFRNKHWIYSLKKSGEQHKKAILVSPNDPKFWETGLFEKNVEIKDCYPFEIIRTVKGTRKLETINELSNCCGQVNSK